MYKDVHNICHLQVIRNRIQTITYDKVLKTNKMYANITESLFFCKKIRQNPRLEEIFFKFRFKKLVCLLRYYLVQNMTFMD